VIKVLDHDVLGQLQIPDDELWLPEECVGANHFVVGELFVDVVGDVAESQLAGEELPGGFSSERKVPGLFSYSSRTENIKTLILEEAC
jgi:hypothetical protein